MRKIVAVRTFADWQQPLRPGFMEMDLVMHCGPRAEGSFVHTLVLTDVASGWTECVALPVREQSLIVEAITGLRPKLPFALLGLDTDNDSAFMNDTLYNYCREQGTSRENMAQVALIGHSKPKTSKVRARISKSLSDHAVANSWWSPSSLSACLNRDFYVHKIQPQLKAVRVREIAQAMQVSQPYAAHVRAGQRRPHPRHWQVLARLVSVAPS